MPPSLFLDCFDKMHKFLPDLDLENFHNIFVCISLPTRTSGDCKIGLRAGYISNGKHRQKLFGVEFEELSIHSQPGDCLSRVQLSISQLVVAT